MNRTTLFVIVLNGDARPPPTVEEHGHGETHHTDIPSHWKHD